MLEVRNIGGLGYAPQVQSFTAAKKDYNGADKYDFASSVYPQGKDEKTSKSKNTFWKALGAVALAVGGALFLKKTTKGQELLGKAKDLFKKAKDAIKGLNKSAGETVPKPEVKPTGTAVENLPVKIEDKTVKNAMESSKQAGEVVPKPEVKTTGTTDENLPVKKEETAIKEIAEGTKPAEEVVQTTQTVKTTKHKKDKVKTRRRVIAEQSGIAPRTKVKGEGKDAIHKVRRNKKQITEATRLREEAEAFS